MATRILSFPAQPAAFRRSPGQRFIPGASPLPKATRGSLHLLARAPETPVAAVPPSHAQAGRIVRQVEREIACKAERQAGERLLARKPAQRLIILSPRLEGADPSAAPQAGLRHRLLDALLFFGRPA